VIANRIKWAKASDVEEIVNVLLKGISQTLAEGGQVEIRYSKCLACAIAAPGQQGIPSSALL
jgi:hypothetical protein